MPSVSAISSTASVDIKNSPIDVQLVTTDINGNLLTVKAKVSDQNSFKDIEDVEVQLSKDSSIIKEFSPAELDSSSGTEALYIYKTELSDYGIYTAEVKAYDSSTSDKNSVKFEYSEKESTPTGAFIAYNKGKGLISRLFGFFRTLFD
ncbi:hypothetical protein GF336_02120 [Candidatus Woesearchaeota archaeon]|nr:hypothetical protein [Candidatus Woesearchaeota archaeon]